MTTNRTPMLILLLILILSLVSCGSSNSSTPAADATTTTSPEPDNAPTTGNNPNDDGTISQPGDSTPQGNVINQNNAVALVTQAFEIFSGRAYDDRLNFLPFRNDDSDQCANDGSLTHTDDTWELMSCKIGGDLIDGRLMEAVDSEGLERQFSDYTARFDPDGLMHVNGMIRIACCTPGNLFMTSGLDYEFTYPAGTLLVQGSHTVKSIDATRGRMSGGFTMIPPVASTHQFTVSTPTEFTSDYGDNLSPEELESLRTRWQFNAGELHIKADDDSALTLNTTDASDADAVKIMIVNTGGTTELELPWSTFSESLRWSPGAQMGTFTRDNSIGIIDEIFAMYTGQAYKDVVLELPGYSDEQYSAAPPFVANPDENGFGLPVAVSCSGGGDATFTPIWENYYRFTRYGWVYEFNDCQDGPTLLQGSLFHDSRSSWYTYRAAELRRQSDNGTVEMSGSVTYDPYGVYGCEDCRFWNSENLKLSDTRDGTVLQIADATTGFTYNGPNVGRIYTSMTGQLSLRTNTTGGRWIHAKVLDEFSFSTRYDEAAFNDPELQNFTLGTLQLRADNGDMLTLSADNGDVRTVNIRLASRGILTEFTHYWSVWRNSLTYVKDFPPIVGL